MAVAILYEGRISIPRLVVPSFYSAVFMSLAGKQKKVIQAHIANRWESQSWGYCFVVAIIGLFVIMTVGAVIFLF
jgi:hypothetical protein